MLLRLVPEQCPATCILGDTGGFKLLPTLQCEVGGETVVMQTTSLPACQSRFIPTTPRWANLNSLSTKVCSKPPVTPNTNVHVKASLTIF